ncbi:MAG: RHS repeat-associated core domain-containing protein [Spirochaetales bacterium]|nr:RHS repeat-associated core domain-containing protein [Spirochaetales bacterium]
MNKIKISYTLLFLVLLLSPWYIAAQDAGDTRYNSHMNLPFNAKEGDVNPQTGDISIRATDVALPGRGGYNFTFDRIWSLNRANVFNMYYDGGNKLNSNTIDRQVRMGAGWSSSLPFILENTDGSHTTLNLFFDTGVYEIDRTGIESDRDDRSNLTGYDLLDKRIQKSTERNYGMFDDNDLGLTLISLGMDGEAGVESSYVLILKSQEKYWFRADGKLMMQEDVCGNRIWYFYEEDPLFGTRLSFVIDTIGRQIDFAYTPEGNVGTITWEIEKGSIDGNGDLIWDFETRSISYTYESVEQYFSEYDWAAFAADIIDYAETYLLTSVKDPVNTRIGTETRYEYSSGYAWFTFDSLRAWQKQNLYAMLTAVYTHYSEDGAPCFKNKRVMEYDNPENDPHRKDFYSGYMDTYKISRQYIVTRQNNGIAGREMLETKYRYFDDGENGNFGKYQTIVQTGNKTETYTYSLDTAPGFYNVLVSLVTETVDGSVARRNYEYDSKRTKTGVREYRNNLKGNVRFIFDEAYDYDEKGNLTYQRDKIGAEQSIQYHEKFSIPSVITRYVTVEGNKKEYKTSYKIDERGLVTDEIILFTGETGTGRLLTLISYTYDSYGNITATTDPHGNEIHTTYDIQGCFPVCNVRDVTFEDWSTKTGDYWIVPPDVEEIRQVKNYTMYNTDGTLWMEINSRGYGFGHYYDENGFEIMSVKPDENDYTDFITAGITDLRTNAVHFTDFCAGRKGNPGVRIYPDYQGDFIHTVTDIDITEGTKKVNAIQKDGIGNPVREIEYEVLGSFIESDITDVNLQQHSVKISTYDSLGRMIALTDPDAKEAFTEKMVHNTVVQKHDKTWIVYYDDLNRKKEVHYPVTTDNGLPKIKQYVYDNYENAVFILDEENRATKERQDWNGNLVELIQYKDSLMNLPDALVHHYIYDELNRKIRFIDPEGIVTDYQYDERDLLMKETYFDADAAGPGHSDRFVYNDKGLPVQKTDRKGQIITFTYDQRDRLIHAKHYKSAADQDDGISCYDVFLVYDSAGNEILVNNGTIIEYYTYDSRNRIIGLDRKIEEPLDRFDISQVFQFSYTYNDMDLIKEMIYPDGSVHSYTYNSLARLKTISTGSPFVTGMEYSPAGTVTKMDYTNGITQEWKFDNRKRISHILVSGMSGADVIDDLRYTVNGIGNIVSINDNEYTYDTFNRLTGAKIMKTWIDEDGRDPVKLIDDSFGSFPDFPSYDTGGNEYGYIAGADLNLDNRINGVDYILSLIEKEDLYDNEVFEYDNNGNRVRLLQNGDEYKYEYGVRNRLLKIRKKTIDSYNYKTLITYEYDENGNITKRTTFDEFGDPRDELFEYDVLNRLVSTIDESRGIPVTTTYLYDNAGNRLIKKTDTGSTTVYLRHGQIAVAMDIEIPLPAETEYKQKQNRYVLSGDLLAGRITKTILSDDTEEVETSFYHLDHLNSTKSVTDENGEIVVKYIYRAFGEQLKRMDKEGNDTDDNAKYSYGGKELDEENNLYYFNARYYDATTGRFINVDPVQDGTNWYVYVSNNPLNMVDPTGLSEKLVEFYARELDSTSDKAWNLTRKNKWEYCGEIIGGPREDTYLSSFRGKILFSGPENSSEADKKISCKCVEDAFSRGTYHTHPNDKNSKDLSFSSNDFIYFKERDSFINFVETDSKRYALVVSDKSKFDSYFANNTPDEIHEQFKSMEFKYTLYYMYKKDYSQEEAQTKARHATVRIMAKRAGMDYYESTDKAKLDFKKVK